MRSPLLLLLLLLPPSLSFLPPPLSSPRTFLLSTPSSLPTVPLVEGLLTAALEPTSLLVTSDESDPNGSHCAISVTSPRFEGLSTLKRQRLVYSALKEVMAVDGGRLHAVDSMVCKAPGEDK
ncbi:hypothetical protein TeGR_g1866 [Tetraparma gracilis]|uniref:Uncharacterized protein n=1 Tax=Tetraparma gracilis TaxID=2962635 RepID=A0ABQ6MSS5_9STRA|nr:hypothetical protein TeGR_g1866 [Tetraparma gracilis]